MRVRPALGVVPASGAAGPGEEIHAHGVEDRGRRRGLAGRAARHRDAAPRRLRRPHRARSAPSRRCPYDRPPLSKQLLAGEVGPDDIALRRASYDDLDLELRLGTRAVEPRSRAASASPSTTGDRSRSTGSCSPPAARRACCRARPISTVCSCCARSRTRSRSARRSTRDPRVVVVGAGFIGSEVAATCRLRGLEVTVLEALPAPLVRGLGPVLGMVCGELHRDHGVDLRLGVGVAGFDGTDARRAGPARRRHRGRRRRRRRGRRRRAGHRLARRVRAPARQRRRVRRHTARGAGRGLAPATSRAGRTRCSAAS